MFGRLGATELFLILGIALLLFGNRLPNVGKALGEGIRNFKKGLTPGEDDTPAPVSTEAQSASRDAKATVPAAHQQQQTSAHPSTPVLAVAVQPQPLSSHPGTHQNSHTPASSAGHEIVDLEHRDSHK